MATVPTVKGAIVSNRIDKGRDAEKIREVSNRNYRYCSKLAAENWKRTTSDWEKRERELKGLPFCACRNAAEAGDLKAIEVEKKVLRSDDRGKAVLLGNAVCVRIGLTAAAVHVASVALVD
jgi:hypothetical protein